MKRVVTFFVAAMLTAQAWAAVNFDFSAVSSSGQTLYYKKTSATEVSVVYPNISGSDYYSGYTKPFGNLAIPQTVTNENVSYSVTSIGSDAFQKCSGLTSVTIPNSVTSIGSNAFYKCSGLTSVTIPNSVTSIGGSAFYGCSSLTTVTIPNSVTSIGYSAFAYCSGLTSITIPNSVTSIGFETFRDCSSLTSVTIPNSVTSIGSSAFRGCSKLTEINVESANTNYASENGVLFNKNKTTIVCYPAGKTETTYTIPNSVTSIANSAFYGCSGLTSVTIPNSVTSIANSAFGDCSGLTSVTIPNSVTSIANSAFYGCSGLTSVTIPNSVTSISSSAFRGCSGLTSVTIPNSVTSIGGDAFAGCSGLTSVTIPNSVTSIGGYAFQYCSGLTSVTIPNSVTSIGNYAFSGCSGLTTVTIPNSVTSIGNYAFYYCNGLTDIAYDGTSAPTIGTNAFSGVSSSVKVCVPENYSSTKFGGISVCKGLVHNNATEPTCTETGLTEGWHCSNCRRVFVAQEVIPINSSNHNYALTYAWAEDGSTCSATAICQHNASHVATENATITSAVTTAATCEGEGTTTYTATFENELFSTQTNAVVDIPALGHNYGALTYAWAEDGSTCSATAICQHNASHVATENATITSAETTEATCEGDGTTTYTATFENELFSTQTKAIEDIPSHGHNYGTPAYAWAEDGSTCTATAICQHNASHTATENATITSAVTTAATCEGKGTTTYTATFENELFSTQTKAVVDIPALGHTAAEAVAENYAAPTCTAAGAVDSVVYCTTCKSELNRKTVEISATGHSYSNIVTPPTCTAVGYTTHTCSGCSYSYNSDTVAATGHTEAIDAAVAATCLKTGLSEGKHCSVCEAVIVAQDIIPALGHEFKTYTFDNNATTEADGTETATCEHGCGATDTRTATGTKISTTPEKGTAVTETAAGNVNIYAHGRTIVVENAQDEISVYDAMGRLVGRDAIHRVRAEIRVNTAGVYIVKVGNMAKRVMVND